MAIYKFVVTMIFLTAEKLQLLGTRSGPYAICFKVHLQRNCMSCKLIFWL